MNNKLIVLEGVTTMNFSASPLRKERKRRGTRSLFQNVRAAKRLENLHGLKSAIKKATKKVTSPVKKAAAPVIRTVQKASPIVAPIVAPIVNQVQQQAERAVSIAQQYGVDKLKEVKNTAIQMAKDPAIQNAAIIAAATAVGAPQAGAQIANANTQMRMAYDQYTQMSEQYDTTQRAVQAVNQNPTSENAAKVAAQSNNEETATILRAYIQELDNRVTPAALQSAGLPSTAGTAELTTINKIVIGGVVAGAALLIFLAMKK